MITIQIAGLRAGIENRYDILPRVAEFVTEASPDFVVSVSEEELEQERASAEGDFSPEYLEYVCAYRKIAECLPMYDAFVIHGVAVAVAGDGAYLLTAPSGTGKTTHARIWQMRFGDRVRIINGDKPILRRTEGGFTAFDTPWRGKEGMGDGTSAPVKGICLLGRGKKNTIRPAEPAELLRFLVHQVYLPKDPAHLTTFLSLLEDCIASVPAWVMACNRSFSAAEMSFETMTGLSAGPRPEKPFPI